MNDVIKFGLHKDQVILDEEMIEAELQGFDDCVAGASVRLNAALNKFWSLPDDRLCALLNAHGVVNVIGSEAAAALGLPYDGPEVEGIFPAHEARATALNEMRSKRGLTPLAEIGAKKQITINPSSGLFMVVPPPAEPDFTPAEDLTPP